jgi:transcriptional regulator with XRE-family HTH domain
VPKILPPAHDVHPLDKHVGQKLKQRRLTMGLTQSSLGELVGMTFQQVQKYERGMNRIGASRLYEIASRLKVSLNYFFENAPEVNTLQDNLPNSFAANEQKAFENNIIDFNTRETAELIKAYYRVEDIRKRRKILDLIRAMADEIEG